MKMLKSLLSALRAATPMPLNRCTVTSATRVMSWVFACALLTIGTGFASAECDSCAFKHLLRGEWSGLRTGENLIIGPGQLGLLEAWTTDGGEGRLSLTEEGGANIVLENRAAGSCSVYATLINPNQLNLSLRSGDNKACPSGVYVKVQPIPEEHHYVKRVIRVARCCRWDP